MINLFSVKTNVTRQSKLYIKQYSIFGKDFNFKFFQNKQCLHKLLQDINVKIMLQCSAPYTLYSKLLSSILSNRKQTILASLQLLIYAGEPKIGLSLKLFLPYLVFIYSITSQVKHYYYRGVLSCLQLSFGLISSSAVYLYFISAADAAAVYFVIVE